MSRYVIELRPDCKIVQQICEKDGQIYVGSTGVHYLDEFTVDYIKKNCKSLLDAFYQKGFDDGKAVNDKGCEGCLLQGTGSNICDHCCNSYANQWMARDDKIEVGDEVTHKSDSVDWKAVCIQIDADRRHMNLMGHTGAVGYYLVDDFKKTGRHFDIEKILEAMKA